LTLPPLGAGHHHVDAAAAAARTHEAIAPLEDRDGGAVSLRLLGSAGLDTVTAGLTPHDKRHVSRSPIAERHRVHPAAISCTAQRPVRSSPMALDRPRRVARYRGNKPCRDWRRDQVKGKRPP
jgi:hypothetical protein